MDAYRSTKGFALPVAVFALVMVGVLVTSGFFLANQETRIGVASENSGRAVYLAEEGISSTLLHWSQGGFTGLTVGASSTVNGTEDGGDWTVEVLRTSPQTYFLTSTGEVTEGGIRAGATRSLGTLVRIIIPDLEPPAAIATVGGELVVGGNSEIQGHDTDPDAWDSASCPDPTEDKPGILIDNEEMVDEKGGAHEIDGQPPIEEDTAMTSDDLLDFGDELEWDDLVGMADKVYSTSTTVNNTEPDSVLVDGTYRCRVATKHNWGDPENPGSACFNYFPIIYAAQDLKMNSSSKGQGILLVEGNVEFKGGFEFYGIVITKGEFITAGTGGHVNGGIIATNGSSIHDCESDPQCDPEEGESSVTGNAVVTNSTCASRRAILNNSSLTRPRPLARRSWVDVTALSY